MIICVVAVGDKYIDLSKDVINKFINLGLSVKILTDKPELFLYGDTLKYNKKIFSFFDKLLFSSEMSEKFKTDVLYIDADRLSDVSLKFFKIFKGDWNIIFFDYWQYQIKTDVWTKWENFIDFNMDYYKPFKKFCIKNNMDITKLKCFWEGVFYLPYLNNISNIIYDLENIKPVFEYMSIIRDNLYYGKIGESEGLAFSYIIEKNHLPYKVLYRDYIFNTRII